jgi:hypothetical protein
MKTGLPVRVGDYLISLDMCKQEHSGNCLVFEGHAFHSHLGRRGGNQIFHGKCKVWVYLHFVPRYKRWDFLMFIVCFFMSFFYHYSVFDSFECVDNAQAPSFTEIQDVTDLLV